MTKLFRIILVVFIFSFVFGTVSPLTSKVAAAPNCGTINFYKKSNERDKLTELAAKKDFWVRLDIDPALVTSNTLTLGKGYLFEYSFNGKLYFFDDVSRTTKLERKGTAYVLQGKFDIDNVPNPLIVHIVDGQDKGSGPTLCSVPMGVTFTSGGSNRGIGDTSNSCIPGGTRPEDSGCGTIETAFGSFSGNPGAIARGLLNLGLGIAGGVALLIMIFAGYKLITSRGNPDSIQSGRDLFTAAIIGLLVVIFAAFIIRIIGTTLKIPGISLAPTVFAAEFGGFPLNDPTKFANKSVADVFTDLIPIVFFFAGILAFGFLIVGGFKYMLSRGDQKALDGARSTISGAVKGLVIILLSFLLLQIIQAVLKIRIVSIPNTAFADVNLGQAFNTPFNTFGDLVSSLILVALPLAGLVFFFLLLWGGIKYMLSRGDDKAINSARGVITSALIGLLIIVGSFLIIKIVEGITRMEII